MMLRADIQDWLDWWFGELRMALPKAFGRAGSGADLVLHVSRRGVRLIESDGDESLSSQFDLGDEELSKRLGAAGGTRPNVELRIGRDRFLQRRLAAVRLPRQRLKRMAALDLSSTPLDTANTVVVLAQEHSQRSDASYFAVKRDMLEALVKAVEKGGAIVASISLDTEHGVVPVAPLETLPFLKRAGKRALLDRLGLAAGVVSMVAALMTLAHAQWRLRDGTWLMDQRIEALEVEAKAARTLSEQNTRRLEQFESVRGYKRQAASVARIWDELTAAVPDGSWVTDMRINDNRVTFSGFSPSAAALIPQIEASSLFADPTFAGPVSRSPENQLERFTIDMRLER